MRGLHITPDMTFGECNLDHNDLLILLGGTNWNNQVHQPILEMVSIALDEEVVIAAICGSVDALASSGYLGGRKHTSNNLEYTKVTCPKYKGEEFFEMKSAVSDENLITASSIVPLENLQTIHENRNDYNGKVLITINEKIN